MPHIYSLKTCEKRKELIPNSFILLTVIPFLSRSCTWSAPNHCPLLGANSKDFRVSTEAWYPVIKLVHIIIRNYPPPNNVSGVTGNRKVLSTLRNVSHSYALFNKFLKLDASFLLVFGVFFLLFALCMLIDVAAVEKIPLWRKVFQVAMKSGQWEPGSFDSTKDSCDGYK